MPNAYASVETLKGSLSLPTTGSANDARLRAIAEAASREVDRWTNRHFYARTATLYFGGDATTFLLTPDLVAVTTVKEDTNLDGTFETSFATSDYHLYPFDAGPTAEHVHAPYWGLMIRQSSEGTQDEFLAGQRNYEIVGTWGYGAVTKDSGRKTSASLDATATSVTLNGTADDLQMGWTILVDSEQMYVSSKTSGSTGTSITVIRGVNGSTAATHTATSVVNYYVYPVQVVEAAIGQVSRLIKRGQAGWANAIGIPETGEFQLAVPARGLDPDIKALVGPLRRLGRA